MRSRFVIIRSPAPPAASLDVLANVLVQVLQHVFSAFHHSLSCSTGRKIRAIAAAILSHLLVSTVSRRRPVAVSL